MTRASREDVRGPRVPSSTYRLQLSAGFGFRAVAECLRYLQSLGISDLYLSPILASRTGGHGYDVTDPTRLNPELGTEEDLAALAAAAAAREMGILLDIVPNHMAATPENPWWRDVLERGRASRYARSFDVEWNAPGLEGRLLLPVLAEPFGSALEAGALRVALGEDGFVLRTGGLEVPLWPGSYRLLLPGSADDLSDLLSPGHAAVRRLRALQANGAPEALAPVVRAVSALPPDAGAVTRFDSRTDQRIESVKRSLRRALEDSTAARSFVDSALRATRGVRGRHRTFDHLEALLDRQAYRLAYWRVAHEEIDYRRFFDISDLVAVRVEDPETFEGLHGKVLDLAARRVVTGIRIDHVDGLRDPHGYLETLGRRMAQASGRRPFVVVEKILAPDERLPPWPVAGTTGYRFASLVTGVLADGAGVERLERVAAEAQQVAPFSETAIEAKRMVMVELFGAEVARLTRMFRSLARRDRHGRDLTETDLAAAIVEVTAALPRYRTYVGRGGIRPSDRRAIAEAARAAGADAGPGLAAAVEFLSRILILDPPSGGPAARLSCLPFVLRWQQFTGSVTAKGVEDTALYRHVVLLSMNDVGGDPGRPPPTPAEFHQAMRARVRRMHRGLSATSTHDTKRSEDVRARIAMLSEIPDRWVDHTARWRRWNARHHVDVGGRTAPDAIEELYLYQTLLGVWPVGPPSADLPERVRTHMRKALREAKVHTDWLSPDGAYEAAIECFVDAVVGSLLEPNGRTPFRADFRRLLRMVAFHGAVNALSQVVLKVAAPGIPDVYQGTEVWNLRLTDPDNRAPVDVAELASSLEDLDLRAARDPAGLADDLLAHWEDGRMKQFVLSRALRFRAANSALLERGAYLPLEIDGRRADHVLAFARRYRGRWAIAMVPRLTAALTEPNDFPLGTATWGTNVVILPSDAPDTLTDVFSGKVLSPSPARRERRLLRVARVLGSYPVALLAADPHGRDVV